MSNLETVQSIYAAFGRGDIPFILSQMSDDVDWEYGLDSDVPWLRKRRGPAGVGEFFNALAAVEITRFEPHTLLDGDDVVVALIDIALTVKQTGASLTEEDEVHIWRFDEHGKVARFSHKPDTHAHWQAVQP